MAGDDIFCGQFLHALYFLQGVQRQAPFTSIYKSDCEWSLEFLTFIRLPRMEWRTVFPLLCRAKERR